MVKLPILPSCLGFSLLLSSCGWSGMFDKCEAPSGPGAFLTFRVVDNSGANIPLGRQLRYHPDTVKLYLLGTRTPQSFLRDAGVLAGGLGVIRPDRPLTPNFDYDDTYILYLNRNDQDTIRIKYRAYEDECGFEELDGVRVFFNGKDLFNGPRGTRLPDLIFQKR